MLTRNPELDLHISTQSYEQSGYGFVTARGSELHDRIDLALLELSEEGRVEEIAERWLGAP